MRARDQRLVERLTYDYYDDLSVKERHNDDGSNGDVTERFEYDFLARLKKWERPGSWSVSYGYDDIGNLTSRSFSGGENLTFGYDGGEGGPHAVKTAPWGTYRYDARGNQRETPQGSITYTPFNLPKQITGPTSATFEYDADDRRVRKTVTGTGAGDTIYIAGLFEKRNDRLVYFVNGESAPVAKVERFVEGMGSQETTVYIHGDSLGTPTAITDALGARVGGRSLDPFGNEVNLAAPALNPPFPKRHAGWHGV